MKKTSFYEKDAIIRGKTSSKDTVGKWNSDPTVGSEFHVGFQHAYVSPEMSP